MSCYSLVRGLPRTVLLVAIVVIGVALLPGFFGRHPFRAAIPLVKTLALTRWRSVTHGHCSACRKQDHGKEHQVEPTKNQSSFHDDTLSRYGVGHMDVPACT